ncbi:hypothetical protein M0R45_005810 [Rubus argutus]|uniref:Uncharacterized protein n=1 Tax=Rubus argutus TaxID=59490 RepID=A0AAW1YNS3_RUBAR
MDTQSPPWLSSCIYHHHYHPQRFQSNNTIAASLPKPAIPTTHHEPANFTRNTHQSKFSRELYVLKSRPPRVRGLPQAPKPEHGFHALKSHQPRDKLALPPPVFDQTRLPLHLYRRETIAQLHNGVGDPIPSSTVSIQRHWATDAAGDPRAQFSAPRLHRRTPRCRAKPVRLKLPISRAQPSADLPALCSEEMRK